MVIEFVFEPRLGVCWAEIKKCSSTGGGGGYLEVTALPRLPFFQLGRQLVNPQ